MGGLTNWGLRRSLVTETWRLLDTGPRSAAENMALDEVVLTARSQGKASNTLRFLQFSPRCTLIGYHQAVEQEVRISYCQEHGIEINRRLTGGGGLFWDESQLGWEIFAAQDDGQGPRFPGSAEALYELLCQGTIRGLRHLGVEAAFRPANDIEVDGRKISGTGGTSLGDAFLFQGSLLVDFDVDTMLRALRIPVEKLKDKEVESVKERVTCLAWELEEIPQLPQIKAALAAGFAEVLGVRFEEGPLTPYEEELLAQRLPHFQTEEWIYGVRRPLARRDELRALYKSPGGLIRVSLLVTAQGRRIREAFVTGDFFTYPRRAIFDLEARLKGVPANVEAVREVVESFFATGEIEIPGITAADMVRTLREALEKTSYLEHNIRPEEVNHVFTVVRPLADITHCPVLLLPYCAKLPECEYRFNDGCAQCGDCCIGDAFRLAEEYDLTPISIQNYEHLEEMLERLKEEGVPAFVGSCCEPFYAKHRDDFERIGLPGVLVDVDSSTCYDLGLEQEAYAGRFENQTFLKLDLLERVVARVSRNGRTV
jgi:lipoate-protein ligase A